MKFKHLHHFSARNAVTSIEEILFLDISFLVSLVSRIPSILYKHMPEEIYRAHMYMYVYVIILSRSESGIRVLSFDDTSIETNDETVSFFYLGQLKYTCMYISLNFYFK